MPLDEHEVDRGAKCLLQVRVVEQRELDALHILLRRGRVRAIMSARACKPCGNVRGLKANVHDTRASFMTTLPLAARGRAPTASSREERLSSGVVTALRPRGGTPPTAIVAPQSSFLLLALPAGIHSFASPSPTPAAAWTNATFAPAAPSRLSSAPCRAK